MVVGFGDIVQLGSIEGDDGTVAVATTATTVVFVDIFVTLNREGMMMTDEVETGGGYVTVVVSASSGCCVNLPLLLLLLVVVLLVLWSSLRPWTPLSSCARHVERKNNRQKLKQQAKEKECINNIIDVFLFFFHNPKKR